MSVQSLGKPILVSTTSAAIEALEHARSDLDRSKVVGDRSQIDVPEADVRGGLARLVEFLKKQPQKPKPDKQESQPNDTKKDSKGFRRAAPPVVAAKEVQPSEATEKKADVRVELSQNVILLSDYVRRKIKVLKRGPTHVTSSLSKYIYVSKPKPPKGQQFSRRV